MDTRVSNLLKEWTGWFETAVFPLWIKMGVNSIGGFAEALTMTGQPVLQPRRAMVQCRQIYSFRLALDYSFCSRSEAISAIEFGLDFLIKNYSLPSGGFIHSVHESGEQANTKADLYTQAFVLFGLAHAYELFPARRFAIKNNAKSLIFFLRHERRLQSGGYSEFGDIGTLYQSNPHMHLLEAAISWIKIDSDPEWRDLADELVKLCLEKFIQPNGLLCEHFELNWNPKLHNGKFIFEPGHHFEWAWLLGQYWSVTGTDLSRYQVNLLNTAESFVKDNFVIDEVWSDLTIKSSTSRFWTQCERIKATSQADMVNEACEGVESLFTYFKTPLGGLWNDTRTQDGGFSDQPAKASSLYHIIGAYSEFLSLAKRM